MRKRKKKGKGSSQAGERGKKGGTAWADVRRGRDRDGEGCEKRLDEKGREEGAESNNKRNSIGNLYPASKSTQIEQRRLESTSINLLYGEGRWKVAPRR